MANAESHATVFLDIVPGMTTGLSTLTAGLSSINQQFQNVTSAIDSQIGLVNTSFVTAGVLVSQFAWKATQAFGEYEQGLKIAQAVSNQTAADMQQMSSAVEDFAVKYRTSLSDLTEGLQTLGRAGLNSITEQTEVLENGLQTAKLEGRELNNVLEEIIQNTALLGGDLRSDNFGEQTDYVNDLLVATSMTAPITTHDISETLKYSGGMLAAAGGDIKSEEGKDLIEDYMGAVAAFAQKGVSGSIAGTALRAFFNKPATQDSSVLEGLAAIQLKPEYLWEDGGERMKPVSQQIAIIQGQMDKLNISTMDQMQIWSKIVGGKMGQQMMKLESGDIKSLKRDIEDAQSASDVAQQSMDTFNMKLKSAAEAGEVAFVKFGEHIARILGPILEAVTPILQALANPVISQGAFIAFIAFISRGVNAIRNIISRLRVEISELSAELKKAWSMPHDTYNPKLNKAIEERDERRKRKQIEARDVAGAQRNKDIGKIAQNFSNSAEQLQHVNTQLSHIQKRMDTMLEGTSKTSNQFIVLGKDGTKSMKDISTSSNETKTILDSLPSSITNFGNTSKKIITSLKQDIGELHQELIQYKNALNGVINESYNIYNSGRSSWNNLRYHDVSTNPILAPMKEEDEYEIRKVLAGGPLPKGVDAIGQHEITGNKIVFLQHQRDKDGNIIESLPVSNQIDPDTGAYIPIVDINPYGKAKLQGNEFYSSDATAVYPLAIGAHRTPLTKDALEELAGKQSLTLSEAVNTIIKQKGSVDFTDRKVQDEIFNLMYGGDSSVTRQMLVDNGYTYTMSKEGRAKVAHITNQVDELRKKQQALNQDNKYQQELDELVASVENKYTDKIKKTGDEIERIYEQGKIVPKNINQILLGDKVKQKGKQPRLKDGVPAKGLERLLKDPKEGSIFDTEEWKKTYKDMEKKNAEGKIKAFIKTFSKQDESTQLEILEMIQNRGMGTAEFKKRLKEGMDNKDTLKKLKDKKKRQEKDLENALDKLEKSKKYKDLKDNADNDPEIAKIEKKIEYYNKRIEDLWKQEKHSPGYAPKRTTSIAEDLANKAEADIKDEEDRLLEQFRVADEKINETKAGQKFHEMTRGDQDRYLVQEELNREMLRDREKKALEYEAEYGAEAEKWRKSGLFGDIDGPEKSSTAQWLEKDSSISLGAVMYQNELKDKVADLTDEYHNKFEQLKHANTAITEAQIEELKEIEKKVQDARRELKNAMDKDMSKLNAEYAYYSNVVSGTTPGEAMSNLAGEDLEKLMTAPTNEKRGFLSRIRDALSGGNSFKDLGRSIWNFSNTKEGREGVQSAFRGTGIKSAFDNFKSSFKGAGSSIKSFGSSLINLAGGPIAALTMAIDIAVQAFQYLHQSYQQKLQEAKKKLDDAVSSMDEAETALKSLYREEHPDATNAETNDYLLSLYAVIADGNTTVDKANKAAQEGNQALIDETQKNKKIFDDMHSTQTQSYKAQVDRVEQDANGNLQVIKKEDEILSAEDEHARAVRENSEALRLATAEYQIAMDQFVAIAQTGAFGVDGHWSETTDYGTAFLEYLSNQQSEWASSGAWQLTASQRGEDYQGNKELTGLMLEDFKDAHEKFEPQKQPPEADTYTVAIKHAMGKFMGEQSASDFWKVVQNPQGGRTAAGDAMMQHYLNTNRLSPAQNLRVQQSMKINKKDWQRLGKEMAKYERATGKHALAGDTGNKRIENLIKKLSIDTRLDRANVVRMAQLQQLQDMYSVAESTIIPTQNQIMATTMAHYNVSSGPIAGGVGDSAEGAITAGNNAAQIAALLSVMAMETAIDYAYDKSVLEGTFSGTREDFMSLAGRGDDSVLGKINNFKNSISSALTGGKQQLTSDQASTAILTDYYSPIVAQNNPNMTAEQVAQKAYDLAKSTEGKDFMARYGTASRWYQSTFAPLVKDAYEASDLGEDTGSDDGSGGGSGGDGSDKGDSDSGSKKNRVDLVLCSKKEIPKLNVNLFKKEPSFTVLNKNFKVRDIKVNTQDKPKAILSSVKNAIIDVEKRTDPKIIQDEAGEYDPVAATDGNSTPTGNTSTKIDS